MRQNIHQHIRKHRTGIIFTSLVLSTSGAWAQVETQDHIENVEVYHLESTTSRPPRDLAVAEDLVRRNTTEKCFEQGLAECPIVSLESKVIRVDREFKGYEGAGGPRKHRSDPVYVDVYTYEISCRAAPGSTVLDAFRTQSFNSMPVMRDILYQQESVGYSATLKLDDKEYSGHLWFAQGPIQATAFTGARASSDLPMSDMVWGHPGEFVLRFNSDGVTYWARGKVETTFYLFGSEITVNADVYDSENRQVGSLKLDD